MRIDILAIFQRHFVSGADKLKRNGRSISSCGIIFIIFRLI